MLSKTKNISKIRTEFGINQARANIISKKFGLNLRKFEGRIVKEVKEKIVLFKTRYVLGSKLKTSIRRINGYGMLIRNYRTLRKKSRLPCRGQKTRRNAKTCSKRPFDYQNLASEFYGKGATKKSI